MKTNPRSLRAVALAALLVSIATAQEPTADQLFQRGRDALFQGDYAVAIEHLQKAVATDEAGTNTGYRLQLAKAYRYAGRDTEAEPLLRRILEVSPDHVEAGRSLAEIHAAKKQWKEVLAVLEPLLKYRHDYPTYHLLAGAAYHLNDADKARRYYHHAVELNSSSAVDHYKLGNLHLARSSFALAAGSYRAALRLGLESPVLHYKLASSYFNLRNHFGRVVQVTVKAGRAGTIHHGYFLIEAVPGQVDVFLAASADSAIYQVTKAIDGGLDDLHDIHVLRANIYLNARRYAVAYAMFTEIAPTIPEADKALFSYYHAQAAFGTGAYDDYLWLLGDAIARDAEAFGSDLVVAYEKVAEQYNQAGDLEHYIEYLQKAVAESPRIASLHLKLGHAFREMQRYADAVVQWRMVLDLEPDYAERIELLNLIERHAGS